MTIDTPAPSGARGGEAAARETADTDSSTSQSERRPRLLGRLIGRLRPRPIANIREDLQDALSAATPAESGFSPEERAMLHNILRLREVRVADVMVPRVDIEAVEITTTLADLLKLFEESGHSRMPVYADTLDDPRGMVHIRDLVSHFAKGAKARKAARRKGIGNGNGTSDAVALAPLPGGLDLSRIDLSKTIADVNLMRSVLYVPPSMLAVDLMARMRATRTQMALVIDEYGGTDGLVSLEDIVEMVVGDIEDEHDDEEAMIKDVGDGVLIADAKAEVGELAERLGADFVAAAEAEEVDTIGGLIFSLLGRIPSRGEIVPSFAGYEFQVLEADPRRIRKVRIVPARGVEKRKRTVRKGAAAQEPQDSANASKPADDSSSPAQPERPAA